MTLHAIIKQLILNWRTRVLSGAHSSALTGTLRTFLLLVMMVVGVSEMWGQTQITTLAQLNAMTATGNYKIMADIDAGSYDVSIDDFSGTLEGGTKSDGSFYTISNLKRPLFNSINGGTVKNIILKGVTIDNNSTEVYSGDAGAICYKAEGAARIYNCGILPNSVLREDPDDENKITGFSGSSVSGLRYVGGLVGFLDGTSRVINCYNYANITGGSTRAGIVGYNNYPSNAGTTENVSNIHTMVMNCMFYGDISVTDNLYPIYGGEKIDNDYEATNRPNAKLNNYNYFLYEAPYSKGRHISDSHYNCALAAEERFLVRFEFYRHLLNSTRELAAWYATGVAANGRGKGDENKMAKWVLDKSIAPYPILKKQGVYPSVVNYDPEFTNNATGAKISRSNANLKRNQGKDLGTTLEITIQNRPNDGGGQSAPSGANVETTSLTLPRIDKDTLNYNYNYDKVQLPYYNEVGTGNYTGNRVVTGWKIVSMKGGTSGGYSEEDYDAPNYNYADRDTYGKDIYDTGGSNRVFSQGAYFNVPKGVTGITIEPYWGIAAYLSDAYYDRYGYNNTDDLSQVGGQRYSNNKKYNLITGIRDDTNGQTVFTKVSNAVGALTGASGTPTVYDYAIVLVGNYHHHTTLGKNGAELSSGDTPFTIMSIDLNEDNEPDYCLIYRSGKNKQICPIRFDFITVPGMAMAHKMAEANRESKDRDLAIPGNCCPKGWFEITTTGLIKYGQFEHSDVNKTLAPLIFMGGVIDQFVSNNTANKKNNPDYTDKTSYMLFGDNVWFKMLSNGAHMDHPTRTPHRPISITGGEFEKLYLSGYFRPDANSCTDGDGDNNAECYIDGGNFGEMAGGGQENISGNVTWLIDHADIRSFYGGGLKVVANGSQITGNINTTIKNSYVDLFCGGPKFGDMAAEKTVYTKANDCVFGTYFGAGYGGTSIYRECPSGYNQFEYKNYDFNSWVTGSYDNTGNGRYRGKFLKEKVNNVLTEKGVACGYEYEFFAGSGGNVARLHMKYASFSLAQTHNVTSILTDCTVKGNFYGGGSLGKVDGTATSTLEGCSITGSVFGAGYSASTPTASIMNTGGFTVNGSAGNPKYNEATGVYEKADYPSSTDYTWVHENTTLTNGTQTLTGSVNDNTRTIKTNGDTEGLGRVTGKVTLKITGNTFVKGDKVRMDKDGFVVKDANGDPVVDVDPNYVGGVFGGGDASGAESDTEVIINTTGLKPNCTYNVQNVFGGGNKANVEGDAKVILAGKTIVNGSVFGGGNKGIVEGSTEVNIQQNAPTSNNNSSGNP